MLSSRKNDVILMGVIAQSGYFAPHQAWVDAVLCRQWVTAGDRARRKTSRRRPEKKYGKLTAPVELRPGGVRN
jgi:hypothetical protein